jgi:uncharacterized protein
MEQYEEQIKLAIHELSKILSTNPICGSHNLTHMVQVTMHAKHALLEYPYELNNDEKLEVLLASLLHDIDDLKFFPNNKNYENANKILKTINITENSINNIIKMISLVSSSKNGDIIPENIKEYFLYPRYADRLEAIGIIGVKRCYQYTQTTKMPLYLETTLRPKDENDLWNNIATQTRYRKYNGISMSMIDHYYDKLLRLSKFHIRK